jgi:hypothetical protein
MAPELSEGLHYSIIFYGGRLPSHLTADDQRVLDSIALQRLKRNVAMILDSDRSADGPINRQFARYSLKPGGAQAH